MIKGTWVVIFVHLVEKTIALSSPSLKLLQAQLCTSVWDMGVKSFLSLTNYFTQLKCFDSRCDVRVTLFKVLPNSLLQCSLSAREHLTTMVKPLL